jgi:hypothetical protein
MSKRKKYKKKRKNKARTNPHTERIESPNVKHITKMPSTWEVIVGAALTLFGVGVSYFTGNAKILYVGALGLCLLIFYATHRIVLHLTNEKSVPKVSFYGELTPGDDPMLPLPSGVPPDTVQLLLGDDLRILSASSSAVFSKGGKSFLSIEFRNGRILLTATLLDKSNRYICRVIENEFQISPERAFNPKQPDAHSLIVRDADGVEVLNLKFLNPKTMRITGRFQLPGSPEPLLILPKEGLVWPGGRGGIGGLTLDMLSKGGLIAF